MKWHKPVIVALFTVFIALSACKKEGPANFTLQLKAKYGNQSFALNSANVDAAGRYIVVENLTFYLSHIKLVRADGSMVNVANVWLFNFSDTTGLSVSVNNIQGDFKGISFACGLDSMTNDTTNPNLYSPPNPLSAAYNMYWPMLGYQFEELLGKWDTALIPTMRNGLNYMMATNRAYRQTQLSKSFSVSGSPYTMVLYLDVAQIFNNTTTGQTVNIVTEPFSFSSPADNPVILPAFAGNFANSFTFYGP
jgi:hypothetical protein